MTGMSAMRRWAVALLVAGVAMGVLFVVAVVTTSPEDGANIGAGFLVTLAVPAVVTGLVLLTASARQPKPSVVSTDFPGLAVGAGPGSAQAGWSLALGILGILIGIVGVGPTLSISVVITVVGVAVSVTAIMLGRALRRQAAAPGGALGGLITGIIGLAFEVLKVVGLVLVATIG